LSACPSAISELISPRSLSARQGRPIGVGRRAQSYRAVARSRWISGNLYGRPWRAPTPSCASFSSFSRGFARGDGRRVARTLAARLLYFLVKKNGLAAQLFFCVAFLCLHLLPSMPMCRALEIISEKSGARSNASSQAARPPKPRRVDRDQRSPLAKTGTLSIRCRRRDILLAHNRACSLSHPRRALAEIAAQRGAASINPRR
jgi:hypothetical protein